MKKINDNSLNRKRNNSSYNRQPGNKKPSEFILIICEGDETEPNYFNSLRYQLKLPTVNIQIIKKAGAPKNIIEKAKEASTNQNKDPKLKKSCPHGFDSIWCVFDRENPNNNLTFNKAVEDADANNFKLAISNPSFEFWYILHFRETTRQFMGGQEAKKYLAENFIPNYNESLDVFNLLFANTQVAITASKKILQNHPVKGERFPNPSTTVHELVEKLIIMSIH